MIKSSAILEVNLNNLIYNYKSLKKLVKKSQLAATIKANAYGLGDEQVLKCLYKNGCKHFFVANINEGIKLRKSFKKGYLYVLNGLENNKAKYFTQHNLIPIINSEQEIKYIIRQNIKFGIHFDTGLNRLGIKKINIIDKLYNNKNITIILSHLASSDEKNNKFNKFQNDKFTIIKNLFKNKNTYYSLSNSMGILLGKSFYHSLVRPGISLYGGNYDSNMKKYVKPVIKLKAKVLQIKEIFKDEYVGYNQTYKNNKKKLIAIIGIGYADGVSRLLSNKGYVYYNKYKFKILGRVSMDSITIDISKYKNFIKIGEYVEIINYQNGIDHIANKCNTISNEILTSISSRVERIYK